MRKFQTITTIKDVPSLNQNFNYQQIIVFNKLFSWNRLQTCKNLINIFFLFRFQDLISIIVILIVLGPFTRAHQPHHMLISIYPHWNTIHFSYNVRKQSIRMENFVFSAAASVFSSMIIFDFHLISLINKIFINTPLSSRLFPSSCVEFIGKFDRVR